MPGDPDQAIIEVSLQAAARARSERLLKPATLSLEGRSENGPFRRSQPHLTAWRCGLAALAGRNSRFLPFDTAKKGTVTSAERGTRCLNPDVAKRRTHLELRGDRYVPCDIFMTLRGRVFSARPCFPLPLLLSA